MRRIILACLTLAALATTAKAQITDGHYTDGQGYTCKVEVSDTNGSAPGVDVTITDAGGSRTTNGVEASGSTTTDPKAKSFPEGTTPRGSTAVKGANGKVKKKNAAGNWITLTKVEEPKKQAGGGSDLYPPQLSQPQELTKDSPEAGGSLPGGPQGP